MVDAPLVSQPPRSRDPNRHFWASGIIALALTIALSLVLGNRPPLTALETFARDVRLSRAWPSRPLDSDIVVVAVTDKSLASYPYLSPIDRALLAQLLQTVDQAKPKVVGLDVLLDRPTHPERDAILAATLRQFKTPLVLARSTPRGQEGRFEKTTLANLTTGTANLAADSTDGVIRRLLVWDALGSPTLAGALAQALGRELPENGAPIDFGLTAAGVLPFQIIPAELLVDDPDAAPLLRGKIVLIGGLVGGSDVHSTPLRFAATPTGAAMPGVLIHAFQLRQLLGPPPPLAPQWIWPGLAVTAAAILGLAVGRSIWPTVLQFGLWAVGVLGLTLAAFALAAAGLFMVNMTTVWLAFAIGSLLGFALEGRQRRAQAEVIHRTFGTFLAPEYVRMLVRNPSLATASAYQADIAVLFTDLADFTRMIGRMPVDEVEPLLNAYLHLLTRSVTAHGGTVDKIVGDSVHALFGAPIPQSDAALRALNCAEEIARLSEGFRQSRIATGLGQTRLGVHFGPALVGNFGGASRLDYTAHGATINVTSRLEQANKALGTQVLASADLIKAASTSGRWISIGSVWLRGVDQPLPVFTVLSEQVDAVKLGQAITSLDGRPDIALSQFRALDPVEPIVRLHLARLSHGLCSPIIDLR